MLLLYLARTRTNIHAIEKPASDKLLALTPDKTLMLLLEDEITTRASTIFSPIKIYIVTKSDRSVNHNRTLAIRIYATIIGIFNNIVWFC